MPSGDTPLLKNLKPKRKLSSADASRAYAGNLPSPFVAQPHDMATAAATLPDEHTTSPEPSPENGIEPLDTRPRRKLSREDLALALTLRDKGLSLREIGQRLDRHHSSIAFALAPFQDTRLLATRRLMGASDRLMTRFIAKAKPAEILDVLSRPNVAVLQPAQQQGNSASVQIAIGVLPPGCDQAQTAIEVRASEAAGQETYQQKRDV